MNVIQIQDLIRKIGELNKNIDLQEYFNNGEDILESELKIIEESNNELNHRLLIQLKEKSDVELLQEFISFIDKNDEDLRGFYHKYRMKLSESNNSNPIYNKSIPIICKLIDSKLDVLTSLKIDLLLKIKYFDYKIESDFETSDISHDNAILNNQSQNNIEELIADNLIDNPFPNIFRNYDAYLFFEKLKENICTDQTTQLADYSYVYRKMLQDKFINDEVSPSSFVSFLDKNYNIVLDPLKSWGKLTGKHRVTLYEILKTKSS